MSLQAGLSSDQSAASPMYLLYRRQSDQYRPELRLKPQSVSYTNRSFSSLRQPIFLSNPLKDALFCIGAGISLGNRRPQHRHLLLVLTLFALKQAQGHPHHLAGVGVISRRDFGGDELVQFFRQADIAGRHEAPRFQYRTFGQLCQNMRCRATSKAGSTWRFRIRNRAVSSPPPKPTGSASSCAGNPAKPTPTWASCASNSATWRARARPTNAPSRPAPRRWPHSGTSRCCWNTKASSKRPNATTSRCWSALRKKKKRVSAWATCACSAKISAAPRRPSMAA